MQLARYCPSRQDLVQVRCFLEAALARGNCPSPPFPSTCTCADARDEVGSSLNICSTWLTAYRLHHSFGTAIRSNSTRVRHDAGVMTTYRWAKVRSSGLQALYPSSFTVHSLLDLPTARTRWQRPNISSDLSHQERPKSMMSNGELRLDMTQRHDGLRCWRRRYLHYRLRTRANEGSRKTIMLSPVRSP